MQKRDKYDLLQIGADKCHHFLMIINFLDLSSQRGRAVFGPSSTLQWICPRATDTGRKHDGDYAGSGIVVSYRMMLDLTLTIGLPPPN